MKFATFTYTKGDGSVSPRDILLESSPTENYAGTDLTELDPSEAVAYAHARLELQKEYFAKIAELNEAYDVKHRYRQFKKSGITNLVTETIEG